MADLDRHKEAYREEAYELLAELESSLLELEENPEDREQIGRAFRALHTIKGSGSMFGFDKIASFTHEIETTFDLIRNGEIPVTKEIIDITLAAGDHIRNLLDAPEETDDSAAIRILGAFRKLVPEKHFREKQAAGADRKKPDPSPEAGRRVTYRIQFRPSADIFMKGINPVFLLCELRALGTCRMLAYTDAIPHLHEIDPESCYTYWDVILTSENDINTVRDVFIFVEDGCSLSIDVIDDTGKFDEEFGNKRIGDILIERGFITQDDLSKVLGQQKKIGELLVEANAVEPIKIEAALLEQQAIRDIRENRDQNQTLQQPDSASSIRVSSDKLDRLVDLVGELVTVQARLTQTVSSKNDPELLMIAEEVERLTEELRDNTMSVRLVPIGTLFSKFKRLVRDLSRETGKDIEMVIEGAETEMDKTVIERLNDPLVHLIRNSIDHGIEALEMRNSLGKPKQGLLQLSARHSGAYVLIEVVDDGAGLDPDIIRAKAVEKGLISPDSELSENEIFSLILAPGFSTAKAITNVSGRGVGMDVVKRAIENLRGSIDISSQKGIGTTITLKLPLTLAIIEGLLVMIAEEYFVLPLSTVEECIELTREDVVKTHGRQIANVRGEIIPYIRLRDQFSIGGNRPAIEQVVITKTENQRVGFVVDHVIGEHQTVIKSLGRFYKHIECISGATILGDGTVALILDCTKLVQNAEKEETVY